MTSEGRSSKWIARRKVLPYGQSWGAKVAVASVAAENSKWREGVREGGFRLHSIPEKGARSMISRIID